MKKTLVAMAVIATTSAYAQSSVQIDGIFDVGFQQINYKGADNTVKGFNGNGSSTSQINFRGTEDLGGGLKANFRFESDFNAVSTYANTGLASSINVSSGATTESINSVASTFGNGEIRVGLESAAGRFDIGSVNYNSLSTYLLGQPFGTAIGSGFRTAYILDAQATSQARAENAIKLTTANFNGLNATYYKSYKQTKAANLSTATSTSVTGLIPQANGFTTSMGAYDQQGTTEFGLNYANGPIAASYSSLKVDNIGIPAINSSDAAAGTTTQTVNTGAAKYTMGSWTFGAMNQTNKTNTSSVNNSTTTFSTTYTMGNTVLMAQTGEGKSSAGTYSGSKTKLIGIGADYNMSKRTAVYFRMESIDDNARLMNAAVNPNVIAGSSNVNGLTDQKFSRSAIGLRHSF